jgi:putative flippase GtrA
MLPDRTFAPFLLVGALATALQYLILVALASGAGLPAPLASALGFCASALVNYWLNRRFTFSSRRAHGVALPRFLVVATSGLIMNTAIMWLVVSVVRWHYVLAQVLATSAVVLWTYSLNRHWTFSHQS